MATSIRLIRRYIWLIDTIRRAGSITLQEINRKWAYNTSLNIDNEDEIPERTFHRHRDAIAELFDIEIGCNRFDGNKYYIKNEEVFDKPSFTAWLFNGLSIDNQMLENREVSERIVFAETPGGHEFLSPIIESLSKNRIVSVIYKRFDASASKEWLVEPALLKQSNRRWYLIGRIKGCDSLTVFALDRIQKLDITDQSFEPENLDNIKTQLSEVIGVNIDDDFDCETVVVRVYGKHRAYIDSLPLHFSQRVKDKTADFNDYEFTIRPEYEFQRAILSLGSEAEILSPQWLREEIKWLAEEILKRYNPVK
ncbi:MAG: WYL domain-containing protein [Muribaculaceae bacterium]|nr:WYL domain-containing protein [Muribaculaceae bacterium]